MQRIFNHTAIIHLYNRTGTGTGKYIAKDENHVDRSPKLKRRSTRHVSEITAIASEFGNSAKIIVPRLWLGTDVA